MELLLWNFLTSQVYTTEATCVADLRHHIVYACNIITPKMLRNVQWDGFSRIQHHIVADSGHFEQAIHSEHGTSISTVSSISAL